MTKEELDIQKEIEKYFTESTGFGRDKIKNFMDIVNKALKQKVEQIAELENKIADIKANCDLAIEGRDVKIMELEQENNKLLDVINNQDVKIAELEKGNAKLKADYKVLSCSVGDFDELQEKLEEEQRKNNGLSDQLTKAKEILEELAKMEYVINPPVDKVRSLMVKAEQFLKETEKC